LTCSRSIKKKMKQKYQLHYGKIHSGSIPFLLPTVPNDETSLNHRRLQTQLKDLFLRYDRCYDWSERTRLLNTIRETMDLLYSSHNILSDRMGLSPLSAQPGSGVALHF
jgi:hypothetical protein